MDEETIPQFGDYDEALDYRDRPSAFGLLRREDGKIAAVRIAREDGAVDFDLPGGALDPGEDEAAALRREFLEETGLTVEPGAEIGRAKQYVPDHTTGPVNNLCAYFEVAGEEEGGPVQEADHALIWLDPEQAADMMYKGAAGWAINRWRRRRGHS